MVTSSLWVILISFGRLSIEVCCAHYVLVAVSLDKPALGLAEAQAAFVILEFAHLVWRMT
jgi:hypothetical protein